MQIICKFTERFLIAAITSTRTDATDLYKNCDQFLARTFHYIIIQLASLFIGQRLTNCKLWIVII